MTASDRPLYLLTAACAIAGFVFVWPAHGFSFALAFLFGGFASLGNLFLFSYLTRALSPEGGDKRPWHAGAFVSRYILMFAGGYVIVKALGVDPLAVLLGLFSSTAAVVLSILIELVKSISSTRTNGT